MTWKLALSHVRRPLSESWSSLTVSPSKNFIFRNMLDSASLSLDSLEHVYIVPHSEWATVIEVLLSSTAENIHTWLLLHKTNGAFKIQAEMQQVRSILIKISSWGGVFFYLFIFTFHFGAGSLPNLREKEENLLGKSFNCLPLKRCFHLKGLSSL